MDVVAPAAQATAAGGGARMPAFSANMSSRQMQDVASYLIEDLLAE